VNTSRVKKCTQLPFDFYLPNLNTCIEYDGEQHYKPISTFGGEEGLRKQQLRDKIKELENNTSKVKDLKKELDIAIKEQNFERAIEIRDELKKIN
jgi:protein-arginine kinase activator protein McsA